MTKQQFFKIRQQLYEVTGEIGSIAENADYSGLYIAYNQMNDVLDIIDELGCRLRYLDPETGEEI